ncbi:hypothetical protein [Streptomyces sp. MZ04]|uniref:hypothetical protein n=1 Tax=Streptomyces sp. MZ04 TaxID=2559236 RepID=UPI00107E839E|nr:hypothetical protein [Streptomyces sp. MZ04]TGB11587.1 hypothetical protein E2651_12980 [Streptomyces sp. MZ04]
MAVMTRTFHIATCDVCRLQFDEHGDYWAWDDTPALALDHVSDSDWLRLADDRIVCPRSDTDHYLARGGESPALLRPSCDAMTAAFAP